MPVTFFRIKNHKKNQDLFFVFFLVLGFTFSSVLDPFWSHFGFNFRIDFRGAIFTDFLWFRTTILKSIWPQNLTPEAVGREKVDLRF